MSLKNLPSEQLIESYHQALKLELSPEFIEILRKEIQRRNLEDQMKIFYLL